MGYVNCTIINILQSKYKNRFCIVCCNYGAQTKFGIALYSLREFASLFVCEFVVQKYCVFVVARKFLIKYFLTSTKKFLSSYTLKCHTICLLIKNSKCIFEIKLSCVEIDAVVVQHTI